MIPKPTLVQDILQLILVFEVHHLFHGCYALVAGTQMCWISFRSARSLSTFRQFKTSPDVTLWLLRTLSAAWLFEQVRICLPVSFPYICTYAFNNCLDFCFKKQLLIYPRGKIFHVLILCPYMVYPSRFCEVFVNLPSVPHGQPISTMWLTAGQV